MAEAETAVRKLLAELDEARAEVERWKAAINRQAAAVRMLHANEETEINRLRRKQQEWHQAVATLDSERQANAMLTAEVERLREALERIEAETTGVVRELDNYGICIDAVNFAARAALGPRP